MPHWPNQIVASQDQALPQPDEPPPPRRRLLVGWTTALAALGASTLLLGVGIWLVRHSIAEFMLGAALAERGAEADFRVVNLDFGGVALRDIRFGSEASPDVAIPRAEVRWDWRGVSPRLRSVRLLEPRLRLRIGPGGRVSAGSLDRLEGAPTGRRPVIPRIGLEIIDGLALIEAPFGTIEAKLQAAGTIGRDFSALALIPETSRPGEAYALDGGQAELSIASTDDTIRFRLSAGADALSWNDALALGATLRAAGQAPLDLSRYEAEATVIAASLRARGAAARALSAAAAGRGSTRDDALALAAWDGRAHVRTAALDLGDAAAAAARIDLRAEGMGVRGAGRWTLNADRFAGFALVSDRPSAEGAFAFEARERDAFTGQAHIALAAARLDADARNTLRGAFPDLSGAPVGPTFAQARGALDAAARRFDLVLPVTIAADADGVRVRMTRAAEARAATGARLSLGPLRQDAPALVLQWPGPGLHGAVALNLQGGGAPHATLLLDAIDWTSGAPFEADGTITLADWRAAGASIGADELGVSITIPHAGEGRIDLRGPARVTGPLGDGQVRDLAAQLDLAIAWGSGWRITPNGGCLRTQLGGLDVAGLSFANGAFALCPLGGALIAADARRNLSGGFSVQRLALNGRMAGPAAQPAHLSAENVVGRFSGRTGDIVLALEADAPGLAIDMTEDRTLAIALRRITADARIADGWTIAGAFEHGALADPALPGSVSTMAGRWSAVPENGAPVIRVEAGEAVLTANRPASEAERPLFHPLQLVDVNATLRAGRLDADGAILLLQENARQLADFTAHHEVGAGVGAARVSAPEIAFGPGLQPYDITERARGLVENVRGPASLVANVAWTRERIGAAGRVRLDGVSLATATIPIVHDVRGEIHFDDLFALTTPPGQELRVGLVNPGVAATDGIVRFQLLPQQRVSIEQAEFAFASGVLAISPTTITFGADETEFELTLRSVDAADLVTALNIPDLSASGRVEGSFPLLLTRRTALIRNGVLRSQPGGGVISYSGNAGAGFTGPARIAFDALQRFRYDDLVLRLDGDLNGEVVSAIEFSGENTGRPVDLGPIAPVPGLGRVQVRGVPFLFHVRVTAPFRRLARTAASIVDPGSILDRPRQGEEESVDLEAETPR
jgi:translocation and assembly module TamB